MWRRLSRILVRKLKYNGDVRKYWGLPRVYNPATENHEDCSFQGNFKIIRIGYTRFPRVLHWTRNLPKINHVKEKDVAVGLNFGQEAVLLLITWTNYVSTYIKNLNSNLMLLMSHYFSLSWSSSSFYVLLPLKINLILLEIYWLDIDAQYKSPWRSACVIYFYERLIWSPGVVWAAFYYLYMELGSLGSLCVIILILFH